MPPTFIVLFQENPTQSLQPHHLVSPAELRTKMGFLTQTYTLKDRIKPTTLLAR